MSASVPGVLHLFMENFHGLVVSPPLCSLGTRGCRVRGSQRTRSEDTTDPKNIKHAGVFHKVRRGIRFVKYPVLVF